MLRRACPEDVYCNGDGVLSRSPYRNQTGPVSIPTLLVKGPGSRCTVRKSTWVLHACGVGQAHGKQC